MATTTGTLKSSTSVSSQLGSEQYELLFKFGGWSDEVIVVANPGTHPEMMRIAVGLLNAGQDVRYLTSSSWAADSLIQRVAATPTISATPAAIGIKRRQLPGTIGSKNVVGIARSYELGVQLALKFGLGKPTRMITRRNFKFQRATAKYIAGKEIAVVIAQYTAASEIFNHADRDSLRVLNYPITHHRWLQRAMQEEANANPKWANLLQGHDFTEEQLENLDREVGIADKILVPSSFAAESFVQFGVSPEKLIVTPLGCASADSITGSEPAQGMEVTKSEDREKLRLVYAGQVTQRKGIGYLLDAVDKLADVHLTVVGSTSAAARTRIGEHKNVRLVPSQPRAELYRILRTSDLLVLPSLAEGFGLVALESMANGTPCLLSKATFGPDLIVDGENGYMLDTVSTEAVVARVRSIQQEKSKLRAVGLAAKTTASRYSWARYEAEIATKIIEMLQQSK